MHATHCKKRFHGCFLGLDQGKSSGWSSSGRFHWEFHDGTERHEKFLEKHKDTVLFVKIICEKWFEIFLSYSYNLTLNFNGKKTVENRINSSTMR